MSDLVTDAADPDPSMAVTVDDVGVVRLTWAQGLRITERLATDAMALVDRVNALEPGAVAWLCHGNARA